MPDPAGIVSKVPPGCFTVSGAAEEVGRSASVLRKYAQSGVFVPSQTLTAGKLTVGIYTPADIADLKDFLSRQNRGRPAKDGMRPIGRVMVKDLRRGDVIADPHGNGYVIVDRNWAVSNDGSHRRVLIFKRDLVFGNRGEKFYFPSTKKLMVYVRINPED